jgi:hypothetical protein
MSDSVIVTTEITSSATTRVLSEILAERARQDEKWGDQSDRQDGTSRAFEPMREVYRDACDHAEKTGRATWMHILREESFEAFAEVKDLKRLRKELIQVAAVAVVWIEALDKRIEAASK